MSANLTTWADCFGFAPKGRWEKEEESGIWGDGRGEEEGKKKKQGDPIEIFVSRTGYGVHPDLPNIFTKYLQSI